MQPKTQTQERRLHAYPTGDAWRGETVPQIRLQGKWLQAAGIAPGDAIVVEVRGAGELLIRRPKGGE